MAVLVEAVCVTADDAVLAEGAGAGRIELCAGLSTGGLTPTPAMLEEAKARVAIPIAAMVRPREGGFVASPSELRVMVRDAEALVAAGAEGIVFACVRADGMPDEEGIRAMRDVIEPATAVFHRAFDLSPDLERALETLVRLGVRRLLTSGGAATAAEGAARLGQWRAQFGGQIDLLAGGGIRPENVADVVKTSGVRQVHLGPRRPSADPGGGAYGRFNELDPDAIRATVLAANA